ncbi:MAG: D-cysteine desulfhydrase family protein [Gammaproteobacteria bacterium]
MSIAKSWPHVSLGHFPTPLEPLDRLSRELGGPRLLLKRDDCTGLALGGNKTRKLEFLLADALRQDADTVITAGGLQSNHVRQTAAAANKLGLRCHLVLQPYVNRHDDFYMESGNLLLDGLLEATPHFCAAEVSRDSEMERIANVLRENGATPYIIPGGGSNAVGGLGYAAATEEIMLQGGERGYDISSVVVPCSSGGTQGGLVAGFAKTGDAVDVIGVDVEKPGEALKRKVLEVATGTAGLLGLENTDLAGRLKLLSAYAGEGYGVPTVSMVEALRMLARLEGIVLDPVYSGKAMAGLIDLVRKRELPPDRDTVFIHTGGVPALFAYTPLFGRYAPTSV